MVKFILRKMSHFFTQFDQKGIYNIIQSSTYSTSVKTGVTEICEKYDFYSAKLPKITKGMLIIKTNIL